MAPILSTLVRLAAPTLTTSLGFFHCLDDFVMNEKGYIRQDLGLKKMADTVEAIIGAIWLDSRKDFKAIKEAIVGLLGRRRVDSAYIPR